MQDGARMEANSTKFKANEASKAVHEWINGGAPIMLVLISFALLQEGAAMYASGSQLEFDSCFFNSSQPGVQFFFCRVISLPACLLCSGR